MPETGRKPNVSFIAIGAALTLCGSAAAQQHCDTRATITSKLTHQFRELPQVIGQEPNGNVIEVWAGQDGGWTVLRTYPNGRACIVMSGDSFSRLEAAFGEPL